MHVDVPWVYFCGKGRLLVSGGFLQPGVHISDLPGIPACPLNCSTALLCLSMPQSSPFYEWAASKNSGLFYKENGDTEGLKGCVFMAWILMAVILLFLIVILALTKLRLEISFRGLEPSYTAAIRLSAWSGLISFRKEYPFPFKGQEFSMPDQQIRTADFFRIGKIFFSEENKMPGILKKFLKKVKIRKFDWQTVIGTGNAAHTAVLTGAVYGIKSTITGVLTHYLLVEEMPHYKIEPVYQGEYSRTSLLCILEFKIGNAILTGLLILREWNKHRQPVKGQKPKNSTCKRAVL
ncbi:DUF2953 domain-containing protein [Peribacillus sp. SCS-37]|uniref:DUF2953 domain-containing protein n=1 Tax=Paraperibacillus esterisolvens TaxID=3115296 RepID=UPI0039063A70